MKFQDDYLMRNLMKPAEKARQEIDQLLDKAGQQIRDYEELILGASVGVEAGLYGFLASSTKDSNEYKSVTLTDLWWRRYGRRE